MAIECSNCKATVSADDSFCLNCGRPLRPTGKQRHKPKRALVLVCCLLVLLPVGGYFTLRAIRHDQAKEHINLGNTYLLENNYQQAILAFARAIEIEPKSIDARLGLAAAYVATERSADAEEVLLEAIDINPKRSEPYASLAGIYMVGNEVDRAEELYQQAIATSPGNSEACLGLARLYLQQDKPQEALQVLEGFQGSNNDIQSLKNELTVISAVDLDRSEATLEVGKSLTLAAVVKPETASQTVAWSSSAPDAVEVSATGTVKALRQGTSRITVTTEYGSKTAACTVNVIDPSFFEQRVVYLTTMYDVIFPVFNHPNDISNADLIDLICFRSDNEGFSLKQVQEWGEQVFGPDLKKIKPENTPRILSSGDSFDMAYYHPFLSFATYVRNVSTVSNDIYVDVVHVIIDTNFWEVYDEDDVRDFYYDEFFNPVITLPPDIPLEEKLLSGLPQRRYVFQKGEDGNYYLRKSIKK